MEHAFHVEIGTCPRYRQDSGVLRDRGEVVDANKQKSAENRGHVMATMFIKPALEGGTYRAPHEMNLSQALKHFSTSRQVTDVCAMLGRCIKDNDRFKREALVMEDRSDEERIPLKLSVVAVS